MNGKRGHLILFTQSLKGSIETKVRDYGIGIPQQDLNKVFDPFFYNEKIGEGTGLGLNIVYRIITKDEGKIEVESTEGLGTTFPIKFLKWREAA